MQTLHTENGIEDPIIFEHNGIPFACHRNTEEEVARIAHAYRDFMTMKNGKLTVSWSIYGRRLKEQIASVHPNLHLNHLLWAAGILTTIPLNNIWIREAGKIKSSRVHGPKVMHGPTVQELLFSGARIDDVLDYLDAYTDAKAPGIQLEAAQMITEPQFIILQRNLVL